jgi:hypothetical protein
LQPPRCLSHRGPARPFSLVRRDFAHPPNHLRRFTPQNWGWSWHFQTSPGKDAHPERKPGRPAAAAEPGPTWRAREPPRAGDRPPQDCGGTGVFNERRGISGGGTRRAAAQTNENGRRAVAPSERARASERGWVCPPADDPQKKGAPPKGGRRGENPGGGNRSPPPPRRAKRKPTGRASRREAARGTTARPQPRRRRDSAASRWRGAWARPIPRERSERSARPTCKKFSTSWKIFFHTVEKSAARPPRQLIMLQCKDPFLTLHLYRSGSFPR